MMRTRSTVSWLFVALLILGLTNARPLVEAARAVEVFGSLETGLETRFAQEAIDWWTQGSFELSGSDQTADYRIVMDVTTGSDRGETRFELSHATLNLHRGATRIGVGKKIVSWGAAVDLNPIDVINPIDATDPTGPRLGVGMVDVERYLPGGFEVHGVWTPTFVPVTQTIRPPIGDPIHVPLPENTLGNSEVGALLTYRGQGFDLQAMSFWGWQDFPYVAKTPSGPQAEFIRTQAVGASAVTSIGDVGVWVEGATWMPSKGDAGLQVVVGADYRTASGYHLVGQYHTVDRPNLSQRADHLIAAVKREFGLADQWRVGLIYNLKTEALVFRPGLDLSLSDSLMFSAEAIVSGAEGRDLGLPLKGDGIEAGLTVTF